MEKMTLSEIAGAIGGKIVYGSQDDPSDLSIYNITTDSRNVYEDCLFVAIKGDKFDGHDFAHKFISEGGRAAVISKDVNCYPAVLVDDTKKALLELAGHYRSKFKIPVVAVTGSVGKTSTKSMIAHAFSQEKDVLATQGNFNNEIGLPLSIFRLEHRHEAAVLELGMNHKGEISRLSRAARPDVAVITNIGTAHIGNLGSRENIMKAKLEITDGLSSNGVLILNGDDKFLWNIKGKLPYKTVYYGFKNSDADFFAHDVIIGREKSKFVINIGCSQYHVTVNLTGQHHVYNALAAISASCELGFNMKNIVDGISSFKGVPMRQTIIEKSGIKIIEDCYNASVDSMEAAFEVLKQMSGGGRSFVVLGGMNELGEYEDQLHRHLGSVLSKFRFSVVITVGEKASLIADELKKEGSSKVVSFLTNNDVSDYLQSSIAPGDIVLFKGSRAARLEEISADFIEKL